LRRGLNRIVLSRPRMGGLPYRESHVFLSPEQPTTCTAVEPAASSVFRDQIDSIDRINSTTARDNASMRNEAPYGSQGARGHDRGR
jgi:hypothetical protein